MITLPERSLGPAVKDFFAGNLVFCEGEKKGEPFITESFQDRILNLVYELDEGGERVWKFILIGVPRGNGKSPLCAGIGDFELVFRDDSPQIFCCAASRTQAGLVHRFAYEMSKNGPLSDYLSYPRAQQALGPIKCDSNDGVLKVLSADGLLQHGQNPSVIIEDELHAFVTGKQRELHFAMTSSLHKRTDSVMIVITTAGEDKNSLLGQLYQSMVNRCELEYSDDGCLTVGRDYDSRSLFIWYGAPDDADVKDPKIWRACNPAPWITDEALRLAAYENPESVFRQLYLNQWVVGKSAAFQPAQWDALKVDGKIEEGATVWVGVDIGEHRDRSAVSVIAPDRDGRLRVQATIIAAEGDGGLVTSLPMVESELRRLMDRYSVERINFDPWQMRDLAARLASEGMPMVEYPQNDSHMVPGCMSFMDAVLNGNIIHDGDAGLREHVLNTSIKRSARGGFRFSKPETDNGHALDQTRKIDACIASVMAYAAYQESNEGTGAVWSDIW